MKKIEFKRAGLNLSPIALGTWVYGGNQWGNVDDNESINTIKEAIDNGINIIDTAPIYGFGHSEEIVGQALKGNRAKVILATKCGLVWQGKSVKKDLSSASITKEVEDSLKRLNTDYIDLYQTHWPDEKIPLEETFGTLAKLQEQGKIKHIGLSNANLELITRVDEICKIASVQNEYSFFKPAAGEEVFDYCGQNGIGFFAYGPLAGGILSGKYDKEPNFEKSDVRSFFYRVYRGDAFKEAQKSVQRFRDIAQKYNKPVSAVALRWVTGAKPFIAALSGARNSAQLQQNLQAADLEISQEDINYLNGN